MKETHVPVLIVGGGPVGLALAIDLAWPGIRTLLVDRALPDDVYADAVSILGTVRLTELVVLVGYYETLQLLIGAWAAPLPAGVPPQFEPGA